MKEGRKPKYLEKTPDNELRKMPHTKAERIWQLVNASPEVITLLGVEVHRCAIPDS